MFFLEYFQIVSLCHIYVAFKACDEFTLLISSGWVRVLLMWVAYSVRCQDGWQDHLAREAEGTVADLSVFRCPMKPSACLFISLFICQFAVCLGTEEGQGRLPNLQNDPVNQ